MINEVEPEKKRIYKGFAERNQERNRWLNTSKHYIR